jgi:hypothetical protein
VSRTGRSSPESSPANSYFANSSASICCESASTAERDRQIEAAAFLGKLRGREIDGDAPRRKFEAGIDERRANPVAAFLHFGIGKTDDGKRGKPVREVHLDRDFGGVEPRERTAVEHLERHGELLPTEPLLEFDDAPLQLGELLASAREHPGLDLKFLPSRQIELGECGSEERSQVLFQILGGARREKFADSLAQILK